MPIIHWFIASGEHSFMQCDSLIRSPFATHGAKRSNTTQPSSTAHQRTNSCPYPRLVRSSIFETNLFVASSSTVNQLVQSGATTCWQRTRLGTPSRVPFLQTVRVMIRRSQRHQRLEAAIQQPWAASDERNEGTKTVHHNQPFRNLS